MEYKDAKQYWLAGFFAIFGIVMIMGVVWILGREKGLTEPKFQLNVLYESVGGLIKGAPIRLSGVNVGNVGDIEFLKEEIMDRRVMVRMQVYQKYRNLIDSTAKFLIISEGVLGEKLVEIKIQGGGIPLDPTKPLIGEDPLEIQELAVAFADAANSFRKTSEDLGQNVSQINIKELADIMTETAQSLTHTSHELDKLILDSRYMLRDTRTDMKPLLMELRETTKRSRKLIERVEEKLVEGSLLKIF